MHLSPTETARRFGVTIKALRLYEQRGLLTPVRTRNGSTGSTWRVYGPDQIARLHQILALKRLGLSLARIAEIMAGPDALEPVLAVQEEVLKRECDRLARALGLVQAAREKLASGQALSIDDLANLTKETVMTRLEVTEMGQALKPFADRHFSADDKEAFKKKGIDRDTFTRTLNGLIAEALPLMETGDATAPAALNLAQRWIGMVQQIHANAPDVRAKARAVWNDAMNDPTVAAKLALNREIFRFVQLSIDHLKAQAK